MTTPYSQWAPIVGAGTQLIGAGMASGQLGQQNNLTQFNSARMYALAQGERQRRDMLTRMLMPQMLRDMGQSPEQAQQYMGNLPSGNPSDPTYDPSAPGGLTSNYSPQTGTLPKALGYGTTGLGIAGSLGLLGKGAGAAGAAAAPAVASSLAAPAMAGAAGAGEAGLAGAAAQMAGVAGPGAAVGGGGAAGGVGGAIGSGLGAVGHGIGAGLGAAGSGLASAGEFAGTLGGLLPLTAGIPLIGGLIGAGLLAKHFIGQGRKAANKEVQGIENPFGQGVLPQALSTARTNPALARQQFIQGYNQYLNSENANIQKGGKDALVARQSLTQNPALQQTATSVAQQLGIPNFQWGQPLKA